MSLLCECSHDGCSKLTLGGPCVDHDRAPRQTFVVGRPFSRFAELAASEPRRPLRTGLATAHELMPSVAISDGRTG